MIFLNSARENSLPEVHRAGLARTPRGKVSEIYTMHIGASVPRAATMPMASVSTRVEMPTRMRHADATVF